MTIDNIRFVVYREGDFWIAQCVDFDVAVQAKTVQELRHRIDLTIELERQYAREMGRPAFESLAAAPSYFQEKFDQAPGHYQPSPADDAYELKMCA